MRSTIDALANRAFIQVSEDALAVEPLHALNTGVDGGCDCDGDCGQDDCDCSTGPDSGDDDD